MKRVAIIGCGALGTTLMRILKERLSDRYALCGVMAAHMEHAQETAMRWGCHAYGSVQALVGDRPDIAVELAGADAVHGHAETILRAGGDCGVPEKCECRDWLCAGCRHAGQRAGCHPQLSEHDGQPALHQGEQPAG